MKRITFLMFVLLGLSSTTAVRSQGYTTTFVPLSQGQPGLLFEPVNPGSKANIAIFAMHPDSTYLDAKPFAACVELSTRGYRVLCANTTGSKAGFHSDDDTDTMLLNVKAGVAYLRSLPSVKKVVLLGHSVGGELMAAYQNIAENGVKVCQGPEKLIKCSNRLANMPAADGVMLFDSTLGLPVVTLLSLDPAVVDEDAGQPLNPDLDMYNPQNGFDHKGATYSADFRARFFAAQGERMNRLIDKAEARLALIEAGKGRYTDDEPFIVPGGFGVLNKLNAQDLSLMSRTHKAWPLLQRDGKVTTEIIHSVRVPVYSASSSGFPDNPTTSLEGGGLLTAGGGLVTTVRKFLRTYAVRATKDYSLDETDYHGIDHKSSYFDQVDSVEGITKPLIQIYMTGSYEFFNAELVREHAKSADKTLAFVQGATHNFTPCKACAVAKGLPENYYGDTVKTMFDYVDGWLSEPGRFLAGSPK